MTILITGAGGQLGRHLIQQGDREGMKMTPLTRNRLDISNLSDVKRAFKTIKPDLVINAAAYTQVDQAERDQSLAYKINESGPLHLALCCQSDAIPLIHISTDYVFSGDSKIPYTEDDPINPKGIYGASKAAGEAAIARNLKEHIIIRTSWLYGLYGHNFVKTILRLGKERDVLNVVDDQTGCPTYGEDLADGILRITRRILPLKQAPWGIYHYSGKGSTTWFDFAEAIIGLARKYTDLKVSSILRVSSDTYPTAAKRPEYSLLNTEKIKNAFGVHPLNWKDRLADALDKLLNPNNDQ